MNLAAIADLQKHGTETVRAFLELATFIREQGEQLAIHIEDIAGEMDRERRGNDGAVARVDEITIRNRILDHVSNVVLDCGSVQDLRASLAAALLAQNDAEQSEGQQ
jgi:hypothetical protein